MPAKAGIQVLFWRSGNSLDSRLRGNDGARELDYSSNYLQFSGLRPSIIPLSSLLRPPIALRK